MCIIAYQPINEEITRQQLKNCWSNNPDGAGLMWVEDGEVKILKEGNSFRKYYKKFRSVYGRMKGETPFVHHFRIGTSGSRNVHNVHPFYITENKLAFCHNGILPIAVPKNSKDNDTRIFNEFVLQMIRPDALFTPLIQDMIEEWIGTDKLVFLDNEKEVYIFNENEGEWHKGCWFSNDGHFYESTWVYGGYSGSGYEIEGEYCYFCGAELSTRIEVSTGMCYVCQDNKMWEDYADNEGEMPEDLKMWYENWFEEYKEQRIGQGLRGEYPIGFKYALGKDGQGSEDSGTCYNSDGDCETCISPCEIGYSVVAGKIRSDNRKQLTDGKL
jgi:hypothetical protein